MQFNRLAVALPIASLTVFMALATSACEPSKQSTSGGTNGGDTSGGVVNPNESPNPLIVVAHGTNCYGDRNGKVSVNVSGIRPGGGYSIQVYYPNDVRKRGVAPLTSGAADNRGKASWTFTCGNLSKGNNYRIQASDQSTGAKGADYFDVLTAKK